ncbi:MAG: uracil-DNA glycosylase [Endomicrobium sp.]|jgi:DNA polymerase|nr:uracil-DNA glycosylase [Endomicrobium sp.]
MKLLKYLEILRLTRISLEEYSNWGQDEIHKVTIATTSCNRDSFMKSAYQLSYTENINPQKELNNIKQRVNCCSKCSLGKSRLNAVFGNGAVDASLIFIGEGPGYDEDHKGEPFIGKAGQFLTKIIEAMNYKRETVYISNIVKCHPMIDPCNPEKRSNDRPPSLEEIKACIPYLDMQLEIIRPKIIVTLGASSTRGLLNNEEPISKIRGKLKEYKGIKLIPTFHPAALLRNSNLKKPVWEDMKKVIRYLETGEIW